MNDLSANNKTFMFENSNVRILGNADEPLFCLADVCKILELSTPAKTASQIKEEFDIRGELNSYLIKDANNHTQTATFITEPQLYFVMMRSRAKLAKAFRQWIVNEVIPTIRKTGSYHSPKTYLEALKALVASEEEKQKLALENQTMKPKAEYFDDLVDRKTLTNFRDTAKELHLQPKAFISLLLEKGFIY